MATDDRALFWAALERLAPDNIDASAVHGLRSWLAVRGGDQPLERALLAALLASAPGNAKALERLSVLLFQAGKTREAEQLRRRKAEVDHAQAEVRKMMLDGEDLSPRAGLLAGYSRTLGRAFDAEAWAILAEALQNDRPEPASPLPGHLAQRAAVLCAPYENHGVGEKVPARRLVDLLADSAPRHGRETRDVSGSSARHEGNWPYSRLR